MDTSVKDDGGGTVSDLSDEDIATDLAMMERENYMAPRWQRGIAALRELRRLRAAQRADAERVRSVAFAAAESAISSCYYDDRTQARVITVHGDSTPGCIRHVARTIADRVATELSGAALRDIVDAGAKRFDAQPLHRASIEARAELATAEQASAPVPRDAYCARNGAVGCELHPRGCPGQIPASASAPVLSAEEREALAWVLSYVPTPDSVGGDAEAHLVRLGVACVRRSAR